MLDLASSLSARCACCLPMCGCAMLPKDIGASLDPTVAAVLQCELPLTGATVGPGGTESGHRPNEDVACRLVHLRRQLQLRVVQHGASKRNMPVDAGTAGKPRMAPTSCEPRCFLLHLAGGKNQQRCMAVSHPCPDLSCLRTESSIATLIAQHCTCVHAA